MQLPTRFTDKAEQVRECESESKAVNDASRDNQRQSSSY